MTTLIDDWIRFLCFATPEGLMAQTAVTMVDRKTAD